MKQPLIETLNVTNFSTPIGDMVIGATSRGLRLLEFVEKGRLDHKLAGISQRMGCAILPGETAITRQCARELREYFAGKRREFSLKLDLQGTAFQRSVWDALCRIPFGQTRSYMEQAVSIRKPSAVRAVANANGANPVAIIVPCHRVIGANGTLTGYGGGLWRKQWLLQLERGEKPTARDSVLSPATPASE